MDVQRKGAGRKRVIRRTLYGTLLVSCLVGATVAIGKLKPAVPTVERATVWPDTVKRGPMLRQVRGLGTLVPEQVIWIPAATDGRVARIFVQPGAPLG